MPTKSDALVIGYRTWLRKYAGGQVDWRGKYSGALPPTPPREQLLDRYSFKIALEHGSFNLVINRLAISFNSGKS